MIEKLNTYEEKRVKEPSVKRIWESGSQKHGTFERHFGVRQTKLPMNTSEVGWNRDNYSSLCLLIGMGTFSVNHYDWRKCDRVDDEQYKVTKGNVVTE